MAHVVGVPKRDSCQKCQLPVFLAERMVVGKKTYHRTCLKCARCRSQLSPGSFYETEVDDEYCCETCPDEEEQTDELLRSSDYNNGADVRRSVRSSIAERLAFFEKNKPNEEIAAHKNISDEEKSKSLQRLGESATVSHSAFKMSAAFNDFLKGDEVDEISTDNAEQMEEEIEDDGSGDGSESNSIASTPSVILLSETSTNSATTEAPPLPTSPSPSEKRFTATAQLHIKLEQDNLEENHEKPLPKIKLNNIPYNVSDTESNTSVSTITTILINDKINNNGICKIDSEEIEILNRATETLIKDETKKKDNEAENKIDLGENIITKDNTDDNHKLAQISIADAKQDAEEKEQNIEQQLREELRNLESESCTDEEECPKPQENELQEVCLQESVENRTTTNEDDATTERLSVVRARLEQFEANNKNNNNSTDNQKDDVDQDNISDTFSDKTLLATSANTISTVSIITTETPHEITVPSIIEREKPHETLVPSIIETEKPQETTVPSIIERETSEVPESMQSTVIDHDDNNENDVEMRDKSEQNISLTESAEIEIDVRKTPSGKLSVEEYPQDLNPFKSDDEAESEENKENLQKATKQKDQFNPFDSSDDEVELEKLSRSSRTPSSGGRVPPPRPPPPRISRNPFGDEVIAEAKDENFSRHSSLSSSLTKRTPVPTPRSNM